MKKAEGGPDLDALGKEFDETPDGERLARAEADWARRADTLDPRFGSFKEIDHEAL